jgi:hypothetical protein
MPKEGVGRFCYFLLLLTIPFSLAAPTIDFISPTLANNSYTTNTEVDINISITEANLVEVVYNWDGRNFSFYDSSLVLMMNFDNLSSIGDNQTRVVDHSSFSNNGTLNGTYTNSTGRYSGAAHFDGDDDSIELGTISSGDPLMMANQSVTILAWIYKKSGNSFQRLVDKSNGSTGLNGYAIYIQNDDDINIAVDENTILADAGAQGFTIHDQWHHLAAVINDSYFAIYVDGINITSITYGSGDSPTLPPDVETEMRIGTWNHDIAREWNGSIDELRIYNRTLDHQEIYQHYAANLRKYDPDSWELHVNQSENITTGLADGAYTVYAAVTNSSDTENVSAIRTINIGETPGIVPEWSSSGFLLILAVTGLGFFHIKKK